MYTDYKIKTISRGDVGASVEIAIYEGDYEDVERIDDDGNKVIIKRYVRRKLLGKKRSSFTKDTSFKDIQSSMNIDLAKDKTRTVIDEQKTL